DAAAAEPRRHRQPGEAAADDTDATARTPGVAERPRQVQRAHRLQLDRHPALETAANEDAGEVGDERVRKDRVERHRARRARSFRRAYPPRMPNASDSSKPEPPTSRVGKFIQSYHTFLSTFVIGAAGLIATSIWQYKQSEIARRQAESAEKMSKTQAENQWRIERAEILAKNLQVLASRGSSTADQRYGVLLSLTRGEILDPELAVSYALEVGKDNPEYMKSVLSTTVDKDYSQLGHAFTITCEQKYGVARQVDLCKADELGLRSEAIARLISDDTELFLLGGSAAAGV